MRSLVMAMGVVAACVGATGSQAYEFVVPKGKTARLHGYVFVHPDCTVGETPTVRVTSAPAHGAVWLEHGYTYPTLVADPNIRAACSTHRVPALERSAIEITHTLSF